METPHFLGWIVLSLKLQPTKLHTTRENFLKFKEENEYIKVEKMIEEKVIKDIGVRDTQEWLARLDLGIKIEKCIEDNGECEFDAEH